MSRRRTAVSHMRRLHQRPHSETPPSAQEAKINQDVRRVDRQLGRRCNEIEQLWQTPVTTQHLSRAATRWATNATGAAYTKSPAPTARRSSRFRQERKATLVLWEKRSARNWYVAGVSRQAFSLRARYQRHCVASRPPYEMDAEDGGEESKVVKQIIKLSFQIDSIELNSKKAASLSRKSWPQVPQGSLDVILRCLGRIND